MIKSKISSVSAINKLNSARLPDKNPNLFPASTVTPTSSNSPLIETCALNKIICTSHHDTSIKSALNKIICARHHDISTKSALSTIIQPVSVPLPSNLLPQNKVLFRNNSNNNKENNNGKIDIGTIPLPNTAKVMANFVYQSITAAQLQQYHHSIMGVLPVKTYTAVIHKHLLKSVQSVMGHLHMIHKGIRPTSGDKTVEINALMNEVIEPDYDENICQELPLNQKHKVGVSVFKFDELNGMISTDLPGLFPITSARGNAYILAMYCYTNNAILATGIKSRLAKDIRKGYVMNCTKNCSSLE